MRSVIALISLFALLSTPSDAQQAKSKPGKPKKVVQLRTDLNKVKAKKNEVRKELRQVKTAVVAVRQDINQVDNRLRTLEDSLSETTSKLAKGRYRQKTLGEELKSSEAKLGIAKAQVRARMRAIYMRGETTLVTAFVGAKDMGDLAARKFLMETIARKDHEIFREYKRLTAEVAAKKKAQDQLVVQVHALAARQKGQQASLQDARAEKGEYLGKLKDKVDDLQEVLRAFERDEAAIEGQIRSYLAAQQRPGAIKLPPFAGRFSRPIGGPITSGFGMRYHPILHRVKLHTGVDFGAGYGTTIHAAADGVVIGCSYLRGYGNTVILDHGGGISTVYGHCSRIMVAQGVRVRRGQPIAAVGSTGYSTGPHLHFEVRKNGTPVNPLGSL
jgi:murein DD-endopeptidase MepM/ murein hydrolase activator NlpD